MPVHKSLVLTLLLSSTVCFIGQERKTPVEITMTQTGFVAKGLNEVIEVTACSDSIIHVHAFPASGFKAYDKPWLLSPQSWCHPSAPDLRSEAEDLILQTSGISIKISKEYGDLEFLDAAGTSLLKERRNLPHSYEAASAGNAGLFHTVARFAPDKTEAFYGLGQHQSGQFNYRGATIELGQNNTDIAIPMLLSSRGYGILWNTASFTYVDNRFQQELIFDSLASEGVDYYIIYGPSMDTIIHHYREMTGHVPMLPKWSYGFIQSKDRYKSLDEIVGIVQRYRAEHIPLDAIVQDWYWWKVQGDPVFNANYTNVTGDIDTLHRNNVHTMISTWAQLSPDSSTYQKMMASGHMLGNTQVYDASSKMARDVYWNNLIQPLLKQGWDSFWLDSAEPNESWPYGEDAILRGKTLKIGPGDTYTNVYPLLHNEGVQQKWKQQTDSKRVFLLTRSAFLGSQRVGLSVWSGDIYSSFRDLKNQIAAGLNYSLSGLPYWTTDIGGYWPLNDDQPSSKAFEELYLRWFQFGVFCPVFRTHGHRPNNEMWSYPDVEPQLIAADKLRYRLMSYIYSTAWRLSSEDYTMQRALVMDFPSDPAVRDIGDEFLFGPSLLVSPVLETGARRRRVYLPSGSEWYDYWTNEKLQGGQTVDTAAPLDHLPLFVRAGSILPQDGPIEYAAQTPNKPTEIRIYPGHDADFVLYADEGDGYDYQKGKHATVQLRWFDKDRVLHLGKREGSFPGMFPQQDFIVSVCDEAVGREWREPKMIRYSGHPTDVSFSQ